MTSTFGPIVMWRIPANVATTELFGSRDESR